MFNSNMIFDQLLIEDSFAEGTDFLHACFLIGFRIQTDPNAPGLNIRARALNSADVWCILKDRTHANFYNEPVGTIPHKLSMSKGLYILIVKGTLFATQSVQLIFTVKHFGKTL